MKKALFNVILILFSLNIYAQSDITVIYVDISNSGDKLKKIQSKIKNIVSNENPEKVLLYISNGKSPIITNDLAEISNTTVRLRMLSSPPSPDFIRDVNGLNNQIIENKIVSGIRRHTYSSGVDDKIKFHFFFDDLDYNSLQIRKDMVDIILHCNRLIFPEGLQENCEVLLHLGIKDDKETQEIDEEKIVTKSYRK